MKNNKKIIGFMMVAFLTSPVWGQRQHMNLRQCMEYALQHSSQKAIQRADYDDALLQHRDAILAACTPSVSAGTHAYTNFGRTIDPETNSYISSKSFSNGYSVNAGIMLFDGFSAVNNIKIAKTAVKMGLSREQQLNDEICLSVMQAYYNLVYQTEMTAVWQAQVHTAKDNLQFLQKQYELGQKGYADVAQVEADVADREYRLIMAENQKNEAMLNLKALMLWSMEDSLHIDTSVGRKMQLTATAEQRKSDFDLLAYAKTYQPSAQLAKGQMDQAKYSLRTARGQFLPKLSLNGGWSTNYYTYPGRADFKAPAFSKQFRNNGGEYVQLSLSFPIYDRLSRHSNLRRKKNEYERATATYRQTLKDIESEVSRALQDSKGAQLAYAQAEKRLTAQTEAYRLHQRKFEEGLISPIEFQTVSNTYLNAKAERLNALLQYQLKQSVVRFYEGISYLEQQK